MGSNIANIGNSSGSGAGAGAGAGVVVFGAGAGVIGAGVGVIGAGVWVIGAGAGVGSVDDRTTAQTVNKRIPITRISNNFRILLFPYFVG